MPPNWSVMPCIWPIPAADRNELTQLNRVNRKLCKRLLQYHSEPKTKPLIHSDINFGTLLAFKLVGATEMPI